MTDAEWEKIESKETMLAAWNGSKWDFSGSFSELMKFVFSEEWASNMYAEYYQTFWKKVLAELQGMDGPVEITLDIQFTFGVVPEEQVRSYMRDHKEEGPRILVMHRGDETVSMTAAWLRDFNVEQLQASL